jgi:enoyl-CoA hydratase/carnithine racemase
MRETSWGLVPDLGGTGPLVRAVGYSRAVDICATGRMISAEEGFALGFVTRVVPDLDECIADMAMSIASAPPGAVRDLMPLLALGEINDRQEQLSAERRTQVARLRDLLGGN